MANNVQLIRWINASVNKHVDDARSGKHLYIEGQEIDFENIAEHMELRIVGPRVHEISKGHFHIQIDINIMCSCKLSDNDYAIHDLVGIAYAACEGPINVKKYGTEGDPYIGCFRLRDEPRDIIPWGLVQVSDGILRVNQTSVEAYFEMELDL